MDGRYGNEKTAPYGILVSPQRYEDAALKRFGGVGSIINHKSKSSGANCEFVVSKEMRIELRAIKNIRNGDELFVYIDLGTKLGSRGGATLTQLSK